MRNRFLLFGFIFLFALLTGCAQESHSGMVQSNDENQSPEEKEDTEKQMNIQLYFADDQALDLVETTGSIVFQDEADKYKQTYFALTEVADETMTALWEKDALADIHFAEGVLAFDFHRDGIQQGASAERLQIRSLLQTMFQFPEVNEIVINEQDQNRYGGQIDISAPFTRETLADL